MCTDQKVVTDSEKLRLLADWFDLPSVYYFLKFRKGRNINSEIQEDLRRLADKLEIVDYSLPENDLPRALQKDVARVVVDYLKKALHKRQEQSDGLP